MRKVILIYRAVCILGAALTLALASGSAFASCDFLTGGGFIFPDGGAHANFGVGGGCKDGSPTWGHLEYIDHNNGLNVHWLTITAYLEELTSTDSDGRRIGSRFICGTARTNQFGDVDFVVRANDQGEPGVNDEFDIRLRRNGVIVYSTEFAGAPHKLGGGTGGGGNIQLQKATTGSFGGSCPALFGGV
jgi:hypothetical protein